MTGYSTTDTPEAFQYGTREFVPLDVKQPDGDPYTGAVEVSVHPYGTDPITWVAAVVNEGELGFNIMDLTPGYYECSVRLVAFEPYRPLLDPVRFVIVR